MATSDATQHLRRTEGLRRAALHFAEDFVVGLKQADVDIYITNVRAVQTAAKRNLGHEFNTDQITGLIIFLKNEPRLFKDNQQIFRIASLICDLLDESKDIKRRPLL